MKLDTYEVELAREQLHGVLNRCPLECSLEDCEFCEVRDESLDLRHHWLRDLDDADCLRLARKHRECLQSQLETVVLHD